MNNRSKAFASIAIIILFITLVTLKEHKDTKFLTTVNIGVISPTDETYAQYEYLTKIVEDKLNAICNDSEIKISFNFNVTSGEGSAARVYELVEEQWRQGVDIFVAGGYHSQLTAMRFFVEDNEILILSPSSTNIDMSLDDFIIRMSPNDSVYSPALAPLLKDYGIESILLLGRESIINREGASFVSNFESSGGVIIGTVTYPWESNFSMALNEAERILEFQNAEVGILLLDYVDPYEIHRFSIPYNRLSNVTWINIDTYPYYSMNRVPNVTCMKLLSPSPVLVLCEKTQIIGDMFENRFGEELDFIDGCVYDSCMLLGLSIIELDSTNSSLLQEELPNIAENYVGLTGPLGFDSNGDRDVFRMGLFAFGFDETPGWKMVEYYDYSCN